LTSAVLENKKFVDHHHHYYLHHHQGGYDLHHPWCLLPDVVKKTFGINA